MKTATILLICTMAFLKTVSAQFIDRYGFSLGSSYSTQTWDLKRVSWANLEKEYTLGFSGYFFAEKELCKKISIRSEIGYIQKGFANVDPSFSAPYNDFIIEKTVKLHEVALNMGVKFKPFHCLLNPYIIGGFQCNYLFDYKDATIFEKSSGITYKFYSDDIEKFNKIELDALTGIGVEISELAFIEFNYLPTLTNAYNDASWKIKNHSMQLKLGLNMSTLIGKH